MSEFDFEYYDDILDILCADEEDPEWLIPNFILQGTLNIMAGDAGAGKSYVSYTIGLAIACGLPTLSGIIPAGEPRTVLYCDEENSRQDRNKYLRRSWFGLLKQNGIEIGSEQYKILLRRLKTHFKPMHFQLGGKDWAERLAERIEDVKPHLVVIDTATPAFDIENENDNSEATKATKLIRKLMELVKPTVTFLVLKHAKTVVEKGGRRSIRGAKSWKGSCDQIIFQVRGRGRPSNGLSPTRIEPDKGRAYGLSDRIYITPVWTDADKNGLELIGSFVATKEHRKDEKLDEEEDDD